MMKKNEDHCGCKTVYTPQGLQGPEGPPTADTTIAPLHTIILRKMLKPFAEKGIKVVLEDIEQKEIQKLWGESNE